MILKIELDEVYLINDIFAYARVKTNNLKDFYTIEFKNSKIILKKSQNNIIMYEFVILNSIEAKCIKAI